MSANCEFYQFRARVEIEPCHDPLPMTGDRLGTQAQLLADLGVAPALRDEFEHLTFPGTEDIETRALP